MRTPVANATVSDLGRVAREIRTGARFGTKRDARRLESAARRLQKAHERLLAEEQVARCALRDVARGY